ncbi:hypothetical protein C0Q70_18122 [Pomacea canaliculata]|uniref:Uncharacterized protein n=1 Tax=Pomacea canaliculata TaxID=400727 RepID=A0A2T7NMC2_POMCA|nr:hypothetical protein C0Q70_18122 [Pomacea canaliculata]
MSFSEGVPIQQAPIQQMAPIQQPAPIQLQAPIQLYTLNYPLQLSPLYMMPTREIRAGCLYASDAMAALSPPEAHRLESGIASLVANTITAHYTDPNSSPNPNRTRIYFDVI